MNINVPNSLLGRALLGNSIFTLVCGLASLVDAAPLATAFGIPAPLWLELLGLGLIGYAVALFWIATRLPIDRRLATITSIMDLGWVLGSGLLLVIPDMPFTAPGREVILAVALVVALWAVLQIAGLNSLAKSHA